MSYEKVILELMERVAELEIRVNELEKESNNKKDNEVLEHGSITQMVVDHIKSELNKAKAEGNYDLVLTSGGIQKEMKLKNKTTIVCNAMRKCMDEKSIVVYESPSGYSAMLAIKYIL